MDQLRERLITGVSVLALGATATALVVLLGVTDYFAATIIAIPAISPALNYRVYTDMDQFDYNRYIAENSLSYRGSLAVVSMGLAGIVAVPGGLALYLYAPLSSMYIRFFLGGLLAAVVVFLVGSLTAVRLNREYVDADW